MISNIVMIIVLVVPTIFSVLLTYIYNKFCIRKSHNDNVIFSLIKIALFMLINVYITVNIIIIYIGNNVRFEASCSLGFFMKFLFIAIVVAFIEEAIYLFIPQIITIKIEFLPTNTEEEK